MSMITQCPACGTAFRVTPPQLQAQHGMVRCGRCAHVFDGFETLATLRDDRPPDTGAQTAVADPRPEPAIRPAAHPAVATVPPTPVEAAPEPKFVMPAAASQPEFPAPERLPQTVVPASQPAPVAAAFDDEPLPQRRGGGWALGILLLLLAMAVQGAYFYRSDIAARVPEARPYLDRMCELLSCTVALPQRPRLISIEASDMQAADPANLGLIALTATLRNNAPTEVGYPALDVVLTDTKDHTVARRVFLPAEYRDASQDARAGIPPNAEVTVRLDIDSSDLGAAGFRLDLLPAPMR
ncbi:MAG: DUF3426 domain-containing protein [Sulfuricaulis sp.]|nr:DUF3426 domain-containing protein [Sulfuricaulis sp.]